MGRNVMLRPFSYLLTNEPPAPTGIAFIDIKAHHMQTWLPIFPLQLIIFPGEKVNLHIFEPRYKQLITEIRASGSPFGVPPVIGGEMKMAGTVVELREIVRIYPDGRMDIRCMGTDPFRMEDIHRPCLGKLYDCARTERLQVQMTGDPDKNQRIIEMLTDFYKSLDIQKGLPSADATGLSYLIGHRIGLKPEDEFQLLIEPSETKRQDMIISHLETFIPNAKQQIEIQQRAQLNGHFRKIDSI